MRFYPENLYHIYNRGNNKQVVFIERKNYLFFLRKVRKELLGFCEIPAYCLMPTHFHFLVYTKRNESSDDFESSDDYALNNGIAVLLTIIYQGNQQTRKQIGKFISTEDESKMPDKLRKKFGWILSIHLFSLHSSKSLCSKISKKIRGLGIFVIQGLHRFEKWNVVQSIFGAWIT